MRGLSAIEQTAVERAAAEPMLEQVQAWAAVNSGSRNLDGLATMASLYADSFAALPGEVGLEEPTPVEAMAADGSLRPVAHGRNLHLAVRPEAPVQLLLTGHMDTVFGADHPFQQVSWREPERKSPRLPTWSLIERLCPLELSARKAPTREPSESPEVR